MLYHKQFGEVIAMFGLKLYLKGIAHNFMDEALDITGGIVGAAIGIGLIAGGIFFTVNTTGWDSTSKLVWPYIFVLAIVALLFGLLYRARHS